MIDKEELLRLMEAKGYTREEIEEMAAMYFPWVELQEALDKWVEMLERISGHFESLREEIEKLRELATIDPLPKKDPIRPPRYAGPKNKGRAWNRQPPRLARSSCRKMRR